MYAGCPRYNERILFPPVIFKYVKKNLDIAKPRYGEQILPVVWPLRLYGGSTFLGKMTLFSKINSNSVSKLLSQFPTVKLTTDIHQYMILTNGCQFSDKEYRVHEVTKSQG